MNLLCRLKIRIQEEGFFQTLKYILYASCYCTREFIYNIMLDIHYSHKILKGNIKTSYKYMGSNDIYHTKYSVLPIIFRMVPVKKNDVLVDIGCGKGRVINYWLCKYRHNRIFGIELDKRIARNTALQLSRWKNVTILSGNALKKIPKEGTIFYFYNPFSEEMVKKFEKRMNTLFRNKPITIIYYNPKSLHVFMNKRWNIKYINFEQDLGMKRWGRINKYHDLAIIKNKVDYSSNKGVLK